MINPLLNSLAETFPVEMYDMSIEDLEERKAQKKTFDTAMAAGNFLGIVPKHIYRCIGVGKYAVDRVTGKKYALRKVTK